MRFPDFQTAEMWDLCIRGGIRPEKHMGNPKLDFSDSPEVWKALVKGKRFSGNSWAAAAIPEGSFLSLLPVFINDLRTEGGGVFRTSH